MTRVKICGLTTPDAARIAAEAGADAIGLMFAPSPRRIDPEQARCIGRAAGPFVSKVGVFVGAGTDEVLRSAEYAGLDAVQLHGAQPEQVPVLQAHGLAVIVAHRVRERDGAELLAALEPIAAADAVHLDSYVPGVEGGSGVAFAWPVARAAAAARRVMLAGGLNVANVTQAIAAVSPFGVDVSTGVESAPGEKDPERVRAFIARVRRYDVDQHHA
ncbi:MAG TPA: phosphoribosylanthranilate isomerase [Limnochordia bacterium]|nr:phosphoribosylanthranilate isomerase [Limnochordia bacterium]